MAGERFYLNPESATYADTYVDTYADASGWVWKKRGWANVAPGGAPVTPSPLPSPATGQSSFPSADRYWFDGATGQWRRRGTITTDPGGDPVPAGSWMRGVAGDGAHNGEFATWAGYTPEIVGTWNDASPAVQIQQWSVQSGATFGNWTKPIDTAIGAIWKTQGETWSAAASGAYDTRWTQCLNNLKLARGSTIGTGTVTVMPTGDSLTAVDASALGFKGVLLDKLIAGGKSINYVGSKTSTGPSTLKDPNHEGISGAQNSTFLGQYLDTVPLRQKVSSYTPDVMTYLVGVNDLWSNVPVATALARLEQVMNDVFTAKPNIRVVLCTLPLMGVTQNSQRAAYNTGVRSLVSELASGGKSVTLGELSSVLTSADLQSDGIHWTSAGHTKVANALYPTVLNVVNAVLSSKSTNPKGTTYIRFAHEFSGSFMSNWSVSASEAADFKNAWIRFTNLQRQIFPEGRMVWCPNIGQSTGLDIRNAWPGAAYVDVYGVDGYNAWPAVNTTAAAQAQFEALEASGAPKGYQTHWELAQSYGVPFAICEWATHGVPTDPAQGVDAPVWIEYYYNWLKTHSTLYEILFNLPSWGNGEYGFYPTTKSPLAAAKYKQLWSGLDVPPPPEPDPEPPTGTVVATETWTGANSDGWPAVWVPGLTGTGAVADIQNNTGRLRTGTLSGSYQGGNKITRRHTTPLPANFELVFRFMNQSSECYPGVVWRSDSAMDGVTMYEVRLERGSTVAITKSVNYSGGSIGTTGTFDHSVAGTWYWCRLRVVGSLHKVKMWGGTLASEPTTGGLDGAGYLAQATDSTFTTTNFGFVQLPGASGQSDFFVDDLTVTGL